MEATPRATKIFTQQWVDHYSLMHCQIKLIITNDLNNSHNDNVSYKVKSISLQW